ncbi:MAG: SCO family protein [Pirellulales bacterium]
MFRDFWQFVLAGSMLVQLALLAVASEGSQTNELGVEDPGLGTSVRVEDKVGEFIPLELRFRDEQGSIVKLDRYFKQGKTVVVTLNYSDCPGLCIAQLENLVETLRKLDGRGLVENYEIVTISIDPREQPDKASRTKAKYAGLLRGTKVVEGWHFLVGNQPEITALAKSLGYYYTYDRANNRFNHPAVLYFVSSEGRLCRYLTDLGVEPDQFKLAVSEAGEGKLTRSLAETFVQFCYTYDPEKNRYSADAKKIMAVGFASFAVLMCGFLAPFWFGRSKPKDEAKVTSQFSADDKLTTNS